MRYFISYSDDSQPVAIVCVGIANPVSERRGLQIRTNACRRKAMGRLPIRRLTDRKDR